MRVCCACRLRARRRLQAAEVSHLLCAAACNLPSFRLVQDDRLLGLRHRTQTLAFSCIAMNTEQVAELLGGLLVPDTAVIKQAEAQLGQLCREPVSVVRLLEVASLCPNADIRLYARTRFLLCNIVTM